MSRQVQFIVRKEDHIELLQFAAGQGFQAIPQIIEADTVPIAQCPTTFSSSRSDLSYFYLLPHEFSVAEAFYKELPYKPEYSKLLADTSPVIEISPMTILSNESKRGRIYFCEEKDDPRYAGALKAFNSLARFIKKWPLLKTGRIHIGPKASEQFRPDELD
jgi:hypothetical protein